MSCIIFGKKHRRTLFFFFKLDLFKIFITVVYHIQLTWPQGFHMKLSTLERKR